MKKLILIAAIALAGCNLQTDGTNGMCIISPKDSAKIIYKYLSKQEDLLGEKEQCILDSIGKSQDVLNWTTSRQIQKRNEITYAIYDYECNLRRKAFIDLMKHF